MENKMWCPIMSYQNNSYNNVVRCKGEECAWWNSTDQACCIQTIAYVQINLAELAVGERMLFTREV